MGKSKKSQASATAADPMASTSTGLSSFLLAQADAKDSALDDIFAHSGPSLAFQPKKEDTSKKSKKSKKAKPAPATSDTAMPDGGAEEVSNAEEENGEVNDAELSELESDASLEMPSSDEEEEAGVEEAYAAKLAAQRLKAAAEGVKGKKRKAEEDLEVASDEEDGSDDEGEGPLDINDLIHESLKGVKEDKKAKKGEAKQDPKKVEKARRRAEETPEERDARTIFIGNVPTDCSTSNSRKKALVRHVLQSPALLAALPSSCPPLKLDAIRFRSIAFASKVFGRKDSAPADGEGDANDGGRGRKRAREWRESEGSDQRGIKGGFKAREEDVRSRNDNKAGPLTDAQKRRVAFVRGELNEHKKTCNAYLVIEPLPSSAEGVEMSDITKLLVEHTNNSVFDGVTLRADLVRPRSAAAVLAAAQMAAKPNANLTDVPKSADAANYQITAVEARRTLFVGGLDFAETEENVRSATEAVLVRERGKPDGASFVQNVRIVRDASSGLGKGFCYVLLQDEQCVDELLALPPGKNLKISKRKVRLERCKTSAAAARTKAASRSNAPSPGGPPHPRTSAAAGPRRPIAIAAPRDPTLAKHSSSRPSTSKSEHQVKLAEALAQLAPDERKKIKAVDPERLARRAEKKKQKVLAERYERKQANLAKKGGAAGVAGGVLGRESRGEERKRKEKKRIIQQSKNRTSKKK
ncbi:SPOSA6832_01868 [Sporobolomyces salmonicolor]|uniref:Nucleolar protein 12 n=1 Tax=Sporidiobolus salmonicolor TaxID=5005 RepID=A0A0D6EJS5_SPOSA|nr:SPOSA6832_01868 [Sporobolomyces salmonicolor]